MIGPGTGVAPFRGFLQARRALKQEGKSLGEAHLYFGCRNPQHDYLYQEELEKDQRDGLVTLHTAFSRVEGHAGPHVQDLMKLDSALLIGVLDQGGILYVCGDGSKMAPEVEETIKKAYCEIKGTSKEAADGWLQSLQKDGRYVKDVWSGV